MTESVPKTKKSDRTPFAALLLRHPESCGSVKSRNFWPEMLRNLPEIFNREEKSIHHHRGDPPFFLFLGLRLYGVLPFFPDLWCMPLSLVFPGKCIHHSFFCSVTSGSGDRPRKEGCHGGGVHSFFPGLSTDLVGPKKIRENAAKSPAKSLCKKSKKITNELLQERREKNVRSAEQGLVLIRGLTCFFKLLISCHDVAFVVSTVLVVSSK